MSTNTARRALDDNLKNYVSGQTDPVMFNLCQALRGIVDALDEIRSDVRSLEQKVDQLAARRP